MPESARLTYRRPVNSDFENLHALDNDPVVMQWINGGIPVSRARFETEFMPRYLESHGDSLGTWILEANGRFVGWVILKRSGERSASLGYRLARPAWGQGYATEAATALLAAAFLEEKLDRVTATTYEANTGSIKVLRKIGMQECRRYRLSEEELALQETSVAGSELWDGDDIEFDITREQFTIVASTREE